jgi:hypothetical protein
MRSWSLIILLVLSYACLSQDSPYVLTASGSVDRVGGHFQYYLDENHEEDVTKILTHGTFVKNESEVPNFNITKATIWAKIKVTAQQEADWYLAVDPSSFNKITLYQKTGTGSWKERTIGNTVPDSQREVDFSHFLFKINLNPGDTTTLLLKVRDYFPISFDIKAAPLEAMIGYYNGVDMYNGVCFGIMVMMLIYNLYLFVINKTAIYFYYVLYVLFNIFFTAILAGYSYHLPRSIVTLFYVVPIIPPAGFGFFGMLFTLRLFKEVLPANFKKVVYVFLGIAILDVAISATASKHLAELIIQPLGLLLAVLSISAGIIAIRKKHTSAKFYLLGFGIYMLALGYLIFAAAGIVPIVAATWCILITGCVIECIMLSFALGDKFRLAQQEKEKAQMESLIQAMENERLVKEQNNILERKVKERTLELQEQKEKVEMQKELIEEKQKEILDSIHYARNIQVALLPPEKQIEKMLKRPVIKKSS